MHCGVVSNREVTARLDFTGAAGRAEAAQEIDFVPHILPCSSGFSPETPKWSVVGRASFPWSSAKISGTDLDATTHLGRKKSNGTRRVRRGRRA